MDEAAAPHNYIPDKEGPLLLGLSWRWAIIRIRRTLEGITTAPHVIPHFQRREQKAAQNGGTVDGLCTTCSDNTPATCKHLLWECCKLLLLREEMINKLAPAHETAATSGVYSSYAGV